MAERAKRLRFINEEPWIAKTARQIKLVKLMPQDLHDWFWSWVEDVGAIMRSRDLMAHYAATLIYRVIEELIASLVSETFSKRVSGDFIKRPLSRLNRR
jgi:hypothetical protein